MDILDIDEMLKDDSFLVEKNPDDVSNIIQQWKNQNSLQQQQQEQNDLQQSQQQQINDTYKLDSRTFTRPKRRSAMQKLETQFLNTCNSQQSDIQQQQQSPTTPVLNVQIGGQVRTPMSARSMLQDVSPPFSISSLDRSLDNSVMDNSLVTSADFTHLNFLLSTPSTEANIDFNQNCAGYTLNDMIRDRKALESLTLSADDGALIKDSQISQIDDISLSLLKSGSGWNSMANSAGSEEGGNLGLNINNENSCGNATLTENAENYSVREILGRTTAMNSNQTIDTTFTCWGNGKSFIINRHPESVATMGTDQIILNKTWDQNILNNFAQLPKENSDDIITAKLEATALNETVCIQKSIENPVKVGEKSPVPPSNSNETFDSQQMKEDIEMLRHTPEKQENDIKFFESTPHVNRLRMESNYANSYAPAMRKIIVDANISPITECGSSQHQSFTTPKKTEETSSGGAYCGSPVSHLTGMDLLENVENPNKTYNRRSRLRQKELDDEREQRHKNTIELQDIMDLAEAEAEMLNTANVGEGDEQQFENMLDELGRIKLNPEQIKMQKSLDKIKKRFNCTLNQIEQDNGARPTTHTSNSSGEYGSGHSNTFTSETREETIRKLRDTLRHDTTTEASATFSNPTDAASSSSSSAIGNSNGSSFIVSNMAKSNNNSSSSSSERLLNRRSRLNDDINLKQLSLSPSSANNARIAISNNETELLYNENSSPQQNDIKNETAQTNAITDTQEDIAKYKLAEQRERDRDRFKTIKIVRNKNDDSESATQTVLNVPCIDNDQNEIIDTPLAMNEGISNMMPSNNQNESHNRETKADSPKRVSRSDMEHFEKGKSSNITSAPSGLRQPSESRSLSRPRYISGLQKFSVVSKAASADDLETNENCASTIDTKTSQLSAMYEAKRASNIPGTSSNSSIKPTNKLKSPMGTKAKSLHNLAYNNQGLTTVGSGTVAQTRIGAFGLRKINSGGFGFEQQRMQKQQHQQQVSQPKQKKADVFKKPQPVSGLQSSTSREKGTNAMNRAAAGIARPSSAYYSLNIIPKADADNVQSSVSAANTVAPTGTEDTKMSKNGSQTNIPKPSGIRPPKRSGLPRPASMIRR